MFYVYALLNPLKDMQPFYIGKGKGNRCYSHLTEKGGPRSNRFKLSTIRKIQDSGLEIPVVKLAEGLDEASAYFLEEALIAEFGRNGIDDEGILTNITLASRPPNFSEADDVKKASWSAAISEGNRRAWSNGTRTLTDEIILNLRKGQFQLGGRGNTGVSWCKGLTSSTDERVKLAADKRKGSKRTEETRRKMSDAMKLVHSRPEVREKISNSLKGKPSGMLGKTHSDDTKKKMSEAIQKSHSSDDFKSKMSNLMKGRKYPERIISDETKQKMSDSLKKSWERRRELSRKPE